MRFGTVVGVCASFGVARAAIGTGPHWPGFSALQYMFIFGDSYSTVSWGPTSAPSPSPAEPVGVEWPGVTSVGAFQANWVGYMTRGFNTSSLLAYDYAISGNNVTGFTSQVETFMSTAGQRPAATPWTADNAVFVSWIGINDVGNGAPMDTSIQRVIQQNQNLYALGARNFILINVPPTNRSPMGQPMTGLGDKIVAWNAQLAASALTFSVQNTDTSTLVFSSWDTFTKILDNPARYNISDPNTIGGGVWHDDLHPTGFVHYRLANDLAGYLTSLPAGQSPPPSSSPTPSRSTSTATGPFSITYSGIGIGTSTTRLAASAVYNTPSSTPSASSGSAKCLDWWILQTLGMCIVVLGGL
ncbi:hypothetical protein BDV93DRAFT_526021 [Ceratobasidium sp. AG-I]|nr:hypothetical protein BDV93DRAFT_526021 [Ceratobasidium sp. AG-I]